MKKFLLFIMIFAIIGCGGEDNSNQADDNGSQVNKTITVNPNADSYIEDTEQNDNLTLLLTECDLSPAAGRTVIQYFRSEALGDNHIIRSDFYLPKLSDWENNNYQRAETPNSCNAPGYTSFKTGDLQEARFGYDWDNAYHCGATCNYNLISESHNDYDEYTAIEVTWECTNVGGGGPGGIFGLYIDKHVGKATCN